MEEHQESELRALKLALGLYVVVFALKLAVYFRTNVMALLAEALHTLSDIFISDIHPIVNGYSADMCRTLSVGKPSKEQQDAYDLYLKAQQTTIARAKAGAGIKELEDTLYGELKEAGHEEHVFGPPIHGVGIEFEESPLPPGHAFFHGEKEPPPLEENVVISVGNCGLYLGKFGVRVEDTLVVAKNKPRVLTNYPRRLFE